jgi:peptidoglycan hydrolase CwlO-like protein
MRWMLKISVLILSFTILSCSGINKKTSNDYVIRYINMNLVYEYAYNNSNEAQDLKRKIDSLGRKIEDAEFSEVSVSKSEIRYYKSEIARLREQEKKMKSEFYAGIKAAVNNIAAKYNTDFILNSGDGVVYSRPAYDLTYEVIKELKSLNERTSPVYK